MAPPDGRLARYINRNAQPDAHRNDSPSEQQGFDDLIVKLPDTSAMRTKDKSSKRSKSQNHRPKGNSNIYDTDASEADQTSTTSSVKRETRASGRQPQHSQPANGQQRASKPQPRRRPNEGTFASQPTGSHENHNARDQNLDAQFDNMLADADGAPQGQVYQPGKQYPMAFADTYVQGDSYPPTTSGAPSISEQRARSDSENSHGQNGALAVHNLQSRALNLGSSNQRRSFRPGAEPERAQPQAVVAIKHARPNTGKSSRPSSPVPDGFSFQPAGKKQNFTLNQTAPGQQRPNNNQAKARVGTDVPARIDSLPMGDISGHRGPQTIRAVEPPNRQPPASGHQHHHGATMLPPMHPAQEPAVTSFMPPYQQEPPSDEYGPEGEHDEIQYDENEENKPLIQEDDDGGDDLPDHELDELYAMDYKTLKAESMEKAANAQPYLIDGVPDSAEISDKLAAVHKATSIKDPRHAYKDRASFFASLTIDEWEEAGDWFLGKFGEVVNELRSSRQEKRKAAKAFEDEIEGRDVAVAAKREFTEMALDQMRRNGGHVLSNTPKKGRRTR